MQHLRTGHGLTQADAANRMTGFVLLVVAMRPFGGRLPGRVGPVKVLAGSLTVLLSGTLAQAFPPDLAPVGTLAFLSLGAALGAGSGAVCALVALPAPANKVGSVTGVVGVAGGPGRLRPTAAHGFRVRHKHGTYGSYALGLLLLAAVAAAALTFTETGVRHAVTGNRPARQH